MEVKQYGLDHRRYSSASEVGRDLRKLGYDVSARRRQPWHVTPRDKLEIIEFARDFERAFGKVILAVPTCSQFLDALEKASDDPARWALLTAHPVQCCHKCHFDFEELHVFPFLDAKSRASLQADHDQLAEASSPSAVRKHAVEEIVIFRQARVPERLIAAVEADHRRLIEKEDAANA